MGTYTEFLEDMSFAGFDEETYREELLKIAKGFRRFDEALDIFLVEHGFCGEITDIEQKTAFIKDAYKNHDVDLPRDISKWFKEAKRIEKKTAFPLCFAFGLNVSETEDFMRRVLLERGFDCHNVDELIYFYCMTNGYGYERVKELKAKIGKIKANKKKDMDGNLLYTSAILEETKKFASDDDIVEFVKNNSEQFEYNNVTAYKFIENIWNTISGSKGLAYREKRALYDTFDEKESSAEPKKSGSEWDIYMQIFGLLGDFTDKCFADRNLKPILKDNELIHPLAEDSFPDRDGLNKVLNGVHTSDERVRKTLIILLFYKYWCEMALRKHSYEASYGDGERCLKQINSLMNEVGYPTLYAGNPYDWIFLFAMNDEYPLIAFRGYMKELFYLKEDEIVVNVQ